MADLDLSKMLGSILDYEKFFDNMKEEVQSGKATNEYIVHWLDFVKGCIAEDKEEFE